MKVIIGTGLIVGSALAADHIISPYWWLMLIPSITGGLLIGNAKLHEETHVAETKGTPGRE